MTGCAGSQPTGFSGVTCNDGNFVYLGSLEGKIMAVNLSVRSENLTFPATGEWSYALREPTGGGFSCSAKSIAVAIYGVPAVAGDQVFIGGYNGRVYALNVSARSQGQDFPQRKENEWFYPDVGGALGSIVGSPVVSGDTVYVTSANGKVYCLDKDYGDKKWESAVLSEKLWSTPCVEGDSVYLTTFEGHLYALSAEDGKVTWNFTTKSGIGFVSSPLVYNGTLFAGTFDRKLYAMKVGEDEPLWEFPAGNCFWATPVASNGTVYAASLDGKVYAIDAANGTELWSFDAQSPIVVSPLIFVSPNFGGDWLIVITESGTVYLLGTPIEVYNRVVSEVSLNVSVRAAPCRCIQNGMIYARGQDNVLYAVDIDWAEIAWKFPLSGK